MILEIDDDIANKCDLDSQEALTLLAIAIHRVKGINGALAARILGISEIEFHQLLRQRAGVRDFGVDELVADIKQHLATRPRAATNE